MVLTNEYQDRMRRMFLPNVTRAIRSFAASKPVLIGETSSFWGGGLANVSNRYASGLWLLGELGEVGLAEGHQGMIRQDLIGGYYPLLDYVGGREHPVMPIKFSPNPDYFTTALLQRIIGEAALPRPAVRGKGALGQLLGDYETEHVRAYAFEAKTGHRWGSNATAVLLLNLRQSEEVSVSLRCGAEGISCGSTMVVYRLLPGDGDGLASSLLSVSGTVARVNERHELPDLIGMGESTPADAQIIMPAASYAIVVV